MNRLLWETNNLQLNEQIYSKLVQSISYDMSKLLQALLLERSFLLSLVRALIAPKTPTLHKLLNPHDVSRRSSSATLLR
jgi:hypothetical protein